MRRKKRGHGKALGFKYHGVILERAGQRYQVVHKLGEVTYAVALDRKGLVGGPVEKFYN